MAEKPKPTNNEAEKELDKLQKQFDAYDKNIKDLTLDRMNEAPKQEVELQTKLSSKEIEKSKDIYIKPVRQLASREKFNEKFRKEYEFATEYVCFIAENREIIGEEIELWTKPFVGMPAQLWKVPVNKIIWGPRHVAEQIKKCSYHRLVMQDRPTTSEGGMTYYGSIVADSVIQRLDALPATTKKSIFMGASNF